MGGATALLALLLAAAPAGDGGRFLPLDEVRPGQVGTGHTVVRGTAVDTFSVTILGVMATARPGGDMILARLSGLGLETAGVVAGMSGSPVFVDGRLVGAVAFGWPFSKEPIAGITPIGEMLSLDARPGGREDGPAPRSGGIDPETWRELRTTRGAAALELLFPPAPAAGTGPAPLALPVSVAGIADGDGFLGRFLEGRGMLPVQGAAGGGAADTPAEPLVPGSSIAIELVRGDARMAAIGTVTWVEGERVYALGHPLFGRGSVRFPLSTSRVITVFPSAFSSFKMGVAETPVGAILRDYRPGVVGEIGAPAEMVPFTVTLDLPGAPERLEYEMVDAPRLAPALSALLALNSLASYTASTSPATLRIGLRLVLDDGRVVDHGNLVAGLDPGRDLAGEVGRVVGVLLGNPLEEVALAAVELDVSLAGEIRAAFLDRVVVAPGPHRPGEVLPVTVRYRDYRGETWDMDAPLGLPRDLPPGEYELSVCDGGGAERAEQQRAPGRYEPRDLDRLIALLEAEPARDALVLRLLGPGRNPVVGDRELPGLPAPWQAVIGTPLTHGRASVAEATVFVRSERRLDRMLFGCGSVSVTVEAP